MATARPAPRRSLISKTISAAGVEFLTQRHLGTLTTLMPDGRPHVVAVGFTYEQASGIVRIITDALSLKATNAAERSHVMVSCVDGPRWLSLGGEATVLSDATSVQVAEEFYTLRYKPPRPNPTRVVIAFHVKDILGSSSMISRGES